MKKISPIKRLKESQKNSNLKNWVLILRLTLLSTPKGKKRNRKRKNLTTMTP